MILQEKINIIRLINSEKVGPITFYKLLSKYKSANKAIEALPNLTGKKNIKIFGTDIAEKELEKAEKQNIQIITFKEPEYPEILKTIPDAPPVIYIKGNIEALHNKSVAMVGSRNASHNGKNFTGYLAKELTDCGYTINSGMAIGIDGYAHKGALASANMPKQKTVAVLAGGVDNIYPPAHKDLYNEIIKHGAVISENLIGIEPKPQDFPRRNRIVSGLSLGVIIVEAKQGSGSLITASIALEQGREVFAVPGSPSDPRSYGSNKLIKNGAYLVQNAEDVTEILNKYDIKEFTPRTIQTDLLNTIKTSNKKTKINTTEDPEETNDVKKLLLKILSPTPTSVDEIIREYNLPIPSLSEALLELELSDKIKHVSGNKVVLIQ